MIGADHTIVVLFGILGFLMGGIMIDALDHTGSLNCKWKYFWNNKVKNCDEVHRNSIGLHKPLFVFSTILFCLGLAFSLLIHYLMDYLVIK